MKLALVVAMDSQGVIGREGDLPWRLSADLRRFKRLTMGGSIIMGRRTYESIGRPLPGRYSIVLTRREDYHPPGVDVAHDLDAALDLAQTATGGPWAFIIGGRAVYAAALPRADRIYLTRVRAAVAGDTYFPQMDFSNWKLIEETHHRADARNDYDYSFLVYERPDT